MSLTVKAVLLREGTENEIRRFAVDQDVSTNYAYLTNKVTAIFPGLVNQSFETLWKDPENDYIAFSSDDELTEALGFVNDGVFRLFIKKSDVTRKATSDSDGGVPHPGVTCDGCEQPVCGIRYKCVICPDYDLCSKCEVSGVHKEHAMIRISSPGFAAFMDFGFFPPPPYGGPHQGHPHGHHHRGPPHHGPPPPPPSHMEEGGELGPQVPLPQGPFPQGPCPQGPCPQGPGPQGPCPQGPGPQGPGPRGSNPYGGFGPGQMRRTFWKLMKTMSGANGRDTKAKKKGDKEEGKNEKTESDSSDEGEASPTGDYLKDVGARVAAMLDPLGIDVEVDVEHNGQRRRCRGQGRDNSGPRCSQRATWGSGYSGYGDRSAESASTAGTSNTNPSGQPETVMTEVPATKLTPSTAVTKDKETEMEVASNAKTGEEAMPETAATAEGAGPGPKPTTPGKPADAPATDGAKPPRDSSSPDCDWTIIHGSGANADTPPSGGRLYPQVTPPPSSNPRVVQAVEDMAAMGFSDEGGWLTRLLEVSGGDINKALDAIRANRQQKN